MSRPTVELEVDEVVHETDAAILCLFDTGEEIWIPISQIDEESEVCGRGDEGTLVIPEWLAIEKGLV